MQIDIRDNRNEEVIDSIKICDTNSDYYVVSELWINIDNTIVLNEVGSDRCTVESKEHARNIIKALEKAIELGWFE